jgi:hypothetical protein
MTFKERQKLRTAKYPEYKNKFDREFSIAIRKGQPVNVEELAQSVLKTMGYSDPCKVKVVTEDPALR